MIFTNELKKSIEAIRDNWDLFSVALAAIKEDTALDIIRTLPDDKEKREGLYNITLAVNALESKLQDCVNEFENIKENK